MALSKWKVNPHKRKIIAKGNGSSRHAGKSASVSITFQQSKIFIKRYFLRNKAAFLEPNVLVEKNQSHSYGRSPLHGYKF